MKALVITKPGQLAILEIPAPQIGPYDALVRNEYCGICNSTDAKLIDGTMFWAPPFPFVLGHESCGTVVAVGSKVRKFKEGDRVTRSVAFWPESRADLNVAMGGFAEFGVVKDAQAMAADGDSSLLEDYNCVRQQIIPKDISSIDAALAISLSETASLLRHLPNLRGRTIAIAGTGVAGLAFVLWCKFAGAKVIALGRREEKLQEAIDLGADFALNTTSNDFLQNLFDTAGGSLDGIIEATGDAALANNLLAALSKEGFATAYGVPPTGIHYGERWKNLPVEEHLSLPWVCDLLRRGWIKPEWFISHQWKFTHVVEAFTDVRQGQVKKGFVQITDNP